MFSKKKTRVNWGKDFSMPFKSCSGVIQGYVLGPQLLNEFSSDLGAYLDPECGVKLDKRLLLYLLFADDLILFTHSACKTMTTMTRTTCWSSPFTYFAYINVCCLKLSC